MTHEKLRKSLLDKGWKPEEVEKAINTMSTPDEHFKEVEFHMNGFLYWAALVVAIIGNLMLSVVMIPFLLFLISILNFSFNFKCYFIIFHFV